MTESGERPPSGYQDPEGVTKHEAHEGGERQTDQTRPGPLVSIAALIGRLIAGAVLALAASMATGAIVLGVIEPPSVRAFLRVLVFVVVFVAVNKWLSQMGKHQRA